MTPEALRDEIENGPLAAELAPLVKLGSDAGVAEALNRTREGIRVSRGVVSRDELLSLFFPAVLKLGQAPPEVKAFWAEFRDWYIRPKETFDLSSPKIPLLMDLAKQQGLFTDEEAEAVLYRDGSRAEALWGIGVAVTADDAAKALRPVGADAQ